LLSEQLARMPRKTIMPTGSVEVTHCAGQVTSRLNCSLVPDTGIPPRVGSMGVVPAAEVTEASEMMAVKLRIVEVELLVQVPPVKFAWM
jgi:hypothetical protein